MALTKCAECGGDVSTLAAACPHCGAPFNAPAVRASEPLPQPPPTESSGFPWWAWVIAAVVVFLGIGMCSNETPEGKERTRAKSAIDLCWEEQKRKSLGPGEQRFIAGACEHMERNFEAKYGRKP